MKARIVIVACVLLALLAFSRADAALVFGDPWMGLQTVEGIKSLEIDGALYDVDFNSGSYEGDVPGQAFAQSAVIAVVQEFNEFMETGPVIGFVRDGGTLSGYFVSPYLGGSDLYVGYRVDGLITFWSAIKSQYPPGNMYATFKAVPIPATVVLLGSSLILIGAIRRRF